MALVTNKKVLGNGMAEGGQQRHVVLKNK